MKVNQLRPENLMRQHEELRKTDVAKLLLESGKFKHVPCPACKKDNQKRLFTKKGFTFTKCLNCETVYVNPRPTQEQLTNYYKNSQSISYWNDKIYPKSEKVRRRSIFKPRAKQVFALCKKYIKKAKVLVDVGAGYGTFCEEIKKLSFFKSVVAVEPSTSLAKSCRNKKIVVIEKPIEKVSGIKADVVTNFELIEHLFDPEKFISACYNILSSGGLLILTTPNIKGFDLMELQEKSDNIVAPNHLNYFHPESLSLLLKKFNFEIVEILTPGKLDTQLVHEKVSSGQLKIPDLFLEHVLKNTTLSNAFQKFLAKNNLSSHLWVVARKKVV